MSSGGGSGGAGADSGAGAGDSSHHVVSAEPGVPIASGASHDSGIPTDAHSNNNNNDNTRRRWTTSEDVRFANMVFRHRPHFQRHGTKTVAWESVTAEAKHSIDPDLTVKKVQDHWKKLVREFGPAGKSAHRTRGKSPASSVMQLEEVVSDFLEQMDLFTRARNALKTQTATVNLLKEVEEEAATEMLARGASESAEDATASRSLVLQKLSQRVDGLGSAAQRGTKRAFDTLAYSPVAPDDPEDDGTGDGGVGDGGANAAAGGSRADVVAADGAIATGIPAPLRRVARRVGPADASDAHREFLAQNERFHRQQLALQRESMNQAARLAAANKRDMKLMILAMSAIHSNNTTALEGVIAELDKPLDLSSDAGLTIPSDFEDVLPGGLRFAPGPSVVSLGVGAGAGVGADADGGAGEGAGVGADAGVDADTDVDTDVDAGAGASGAGVGDDAGGAADVVSAVVAAAAESAGIPASAPIVPGLAPRRSVRGAASRI